MHPVGHLLKKTAPLIALLLTAGGLGAQTAVTLVPSGGFPGTSVQVTGYGIGYATGMQILFSPAGMTASNIQPAAGNPAVSFTLTISPGAQPGFYTMQVIGSAGGTFSVPTAFNVAAVPVLSRLIPPSAAIGTDGVVMTLIGGNFLYGATLSANTPGVEIEQFRVLSSTQASALLRIRPNANPGPVRLDITNPDGATTRQQNQIPQLSLFPGNSLVAPLAVRDAAIISPMPGVAVTPEQKLFAEGLLAVTGTGMVTGFFAVDDTPYEQFTVFARGGEPVTVRARTPVPNSFNGPHTLTLQILLPQRFASGPVRIYVDPDSRSGFKLISPAPDSIAPFPATLRWTVAPGAIGYQIELADSDHQLRPQRVFQTRDTEIILTLEQLKGLEAEPLYWTVRPIYAGDSPGAAAPWQPWFRNGPPPRAAYLSGGEKRWREASTRRFIIAPSATDESAAMTTAASPHPSGSWAATINLAGTAISGSRPDQQESVRPALSLQTDLGDGRWYLRDSGDVSYIHTFNPTRTVNESRSWLVQMGRRFGEKGLISGQVGYGGVNILGESQLLSPGLVRGGVEVKLDSVAGQFGAYGSFDNNVPGVGVGSGGGAMHVYAASYRLPLPEEKATIRFMGLWTRQDGTALAPGGNGRVLGALGKFNLTPFSSLYFEAAHGRSTPDFPAAATHGGAYRAGYAYNGATRSFSLNARHTSAGFSNNANPGYTVGGVPDRTGGDLNYSQNFGAVTTQLQYAYLHDSKSAGAGSGREHHASWGLTWLPAPQFMLAGSLTGTWDTRTGDPVTLLPAVKRRQRGFMLSATEQWKRLSFNQTYNGQRMRDAVTPDNQQDVDSFLSSITGGITDNFALAVTGAYTRSRGAPAAGITEFTVLSVSPSWNLPAARLLFTPRAGYTRVRNSIGVMDTRQEQYAFGVQWTPDWLNSLLAFQGSAEYNRNHGGTGPVVPGSLAIGNEHRYTGNLTIRWGGGKGTLNSAPLLVPPIAPAVPAPGMLPSPGTTIPPKTFP